MSRVLRNRVRGFTLVELLVVVVVIGIIATLIIPMFLDAIQKGKQKRAMAEMRIVGTCWMAWLTDQVSASAAGAGGERVYDISEMQEVDARTVLNSLYQTQTFFYCSEVPVLDPWGWEYEYFINPDTLLGSKAIAIRTPGRHGEFDYGNSGRYPLGPFIVTNYDKDILWADGFFIHYPAGLAVMNALPEGGG